MLYWSFVVLFCDLIVMCGVLVLGLPSDMKYFIYLDNMKLAHVVWSCRHAIWNNNEENYVLRSWNNV